MSRDDGHEDDGEKLPFDVEVERLPPWVHVSSALVIVVGVLVALHVVQMLVFLPFLVASSVGRRFASSPRHVVVDGRRLDFGGREIARSEIVDVWVDSEEAEPRVTIAFGDRIELAILHFENREQAKRFGSALGSANDTPVVGYLPRPIDWLSSLRFVAIAGAFFGTGSALGAVVLAVFAFGAWNILRAKQIVARANGVEIRTVLGSQSHPYAEIERVDVEDGVIHLRGGTEISVPRSALRDPTLGSGSWLERARTRVFTRMADTK